MDQFIKQILHCETENGILWYETSPAAPPPVVRPTSAFVPFQNPPRIEVGFNNGVNSGNMKKRLIEFTRKIDWPTKATEEAKQIEKQRCFHHMMNERMRREKQKKSYFALHSKLPLGTKNDKNSIVQTAIKRVQELEWLKKDLERRNYELKANLGANNEGTKIRVRIDNPTYGIDSMLEALKCLKTLDSKPKMIQSESTNQECLAVLDIATEMKAGEVEKVINRTLQESEKKT